MGFESFFHILRGVQRRKTGAGIGGIQNAQQIAFLRNLQKEIHQEDALTVPLQQLKVVVFDIETTGFHPEKGDGILSLGAIKMQGAEVLEETFYSLSRYEEQVPEEIERLTGITTEMLQRHQCFRTFSSNSWNLKRMQPSLPIMQHMKEPLCSTQV